MAEAPNNTHNKRLLIQTSHVCHRHRAAGKNQQVEEYKNTHIHTGTHTHKGAFVIGSLGAQQVNFSGFFSSLFSCACLKHSLFFSK